MEKLRATKRMFGDIFTVTIFVGSQKTRFDVHHDQLCEVSTFFKAAFTSNYKESLKKSIDLLEDDADTVDLFVQWLYKQQLNHLCILADDGGECLMQPIRLLIFSEKYDIPSLKLYILEKLLAHIPEKGSKPPSEDIVEYAYNNTCPGSGIRILLAGWFATYNGRTWFQSRSTQDWLFSNPEIAVDLVVAFSKIPDAIHVPDHIRNNEPEYYMKVWGDDSSSDPSGGESTSISAKFRDVDTVTLFVGASRNVFHVHEDTLCTASPVFKAAFESKFKEGTDRTMELPDDDVDLVEMFISWLYRTTLHDELFKLSAPDPMPALGLSQERLMRNARLFVLAAKYDVEALQACICENLFDIAANGLNEVPSFVVLEFIYANTHRKAIIRRLIADWFAWTEKRRWQGKREESDRISTDWLYNIPEFSVDLALALYDPVRIARSSTPFINSKSKYMQKLQEGTKAPE